MMRWPAPETVAMSPGWMSVVAFGSSMTAGPSTRAPVASDGRIYLSNNDGQTFVVKAGTKFELLATNELGERITASPAISGNELIYRTDSHLYCIGTSVGR